MAEHWYEVTTERLMVGGVPMSRGEKVAQSTIMRRDFHRLGSWLRQGQLAHADNPAQPSGVLDFRSMSKPAIKAWAADNDVEFPDSVTGVADMREFLAEYVKGDDA